jgi:photosystem II stability/assembly factor-like uncharacterized protein
MVLLACASLLLPACQKEQVQPLPEVSVPAGSPFVLVQPQPSLTSKKPPASPYIGVLTGIVTLPGHLVVSGYQGTILRYSLSSRIWTRETSPVHGDLYGLTRSGPGTLWISGDRGLLLRSGDGGVHWKSVSSGVSALFLNAIAFPSPKVGYAVGEKGTILKTSDGGDHWMRLNSSAQKNLYGIAFTDDIHGIIVGWHMTLLTTSDGGDHFASVNLPVQKVTRQKPALNSVWSRKSLVLLAGDHGLLFQSMDSGKSFVQIETGSLHDLYGVCRMENGDIAVAGEGGELVLLSPVPSGGWKKSRPLGSFRGADWLSVSCGNSHVRIVGSNASILLPKSEAPSPPGKKS